ncbi:hypothetical protein FRC03_008920 [Tulasnella sp. 419]|nr:hypothetical protein FRC03_008920 [Tulasnella sp. 419]
MTTPSLDCYTADSESLLLQLAHKISGTPLSARGPSHLPEHYRNLSEFMFTKQYDEYLKAPAMACNAFGNQRMLKAVTTSFVVRDIVSILEALNEEGGLNYWGFSYGTILGSMFAAKNPHLVNRMVLDGVSDAIAYSNDYWEWQRRGIQDARKTISGFFEKCAEAGPEKCPFAKGPPDQSLQQRYDAIFERLLEAPVSAISEQTGLGVFKASDMQELFFEMMYHPDGWANLAQGLADLESGNATILYDSSYSYFSDVRRETNAKDNVFHRHVEKYGSFIWTLAITCTDTPNMNAKPGDEGVKEYLQYLHELLEISPTGESWAVWAGFCRHWKVEPFERYAGPWTVEEGLERTKFPILFVSMTADPVTPLPSAQRMNAAFGNDSSTLLIQQGYGHTSLAQPSLCTAKTIREYFVRGMVPLNGTTCQSE